MSRQDFYYVKETSEVQYTATPTNTIDVSRFLQNKPCWQAPFGGTIRAQKKLIFNGSSSSVEWCFENTITFYERLRDLQTEGFELYIFYQGQVTRLMLKSLTDFATQFEEDFKDKETVLKEAIKTLKISPDEILILNPDRYLAICDGDDEDWKKLGTYQQCDLQDSNITIDSLKSLFERKGTLIEELNLQGCVNLARENFGNLLPRGIKVLRLGLSKTIRTDISPAIFCTMLSDQNIIKLINASKNTLKVLVLSGFDIDNIIRSIELLSNLEVVYLPSIELNLLKVLFEKSHNLKIVNLPLIINTRSSVSLRKTILENNEAIDLFSSHFCLYSFIYNFLTILEKVNITPNLRFNFAVHLIFNNNEIIQIQPDDVRESETKGFIFSASQKNGQYNSDLTGLKITVSSSSLNRVSHYSRFKNILDFNPTFEFYINAHVYNDLNFVTNSHAKPLLGNTQLPLHPHTANAKESLDADTTPDPQKKFNVNKIFFSSDSKNDPAPRDYRLSTFNKLEPNGDSKTCNATNAFTLTNQSVDLQLVTKPITKKDNDVFETLPQSNLSEDNFSNIYYGKTKIQLRRDWQALPSLSARETMLAYHIEPDIQVEIHYSQRDNLYYIRSHNPPTNAITIDFTVYVPDATNSENEIPKNIQTLIKECRVFKEKSLIVPRKSNITGADYLNALHAQKVGSCRHRTAIFLWQMQKDHPNIPVRIVNNDCHSFVEVHIEKKWIACDLGGYSAKLNINDSAKPKSVSVKSITVTPFNAKSEIVFAKQYFEPQQIQEQKPQLLLQYLQSLSSQHKTLLNVQSQDDIAGMRYHLEKYCHDRSTSYFYVHKPEDLICSSAYITCDENNNGTTHKGPGGALHAFLEECRRSQRPSVIIINYDNFKKQDIVRFNAILDPNAIADGTPLPLNTKIIGLRNPNKPDAYTGSDFLSRFDKVDAVPFFGDSCQAPEIAKPATETTTNTYPIELYGGQHWEGILLGSWELDGDKFKLTEGELLKALRTNKTNILLCNAPWNNDEFVSFLQKILLDKKIIVYGREITIPNNFTFTQKTGYDFSKIIHRIQIATPDAITQTKHILNTTTLSQFFWQYRCTQTRLQKEKGILEEYRDKALPLPIYLSAEISEADFAKLLDACDQYKVTLQLSIAKDVKLPHALNNLQINPTPLQPSNIWNQDTSISSTAYCQSTDPSTTATQINDAIIVDVSEINAGDLLNKIDASFDHNALSFSFSQKTGLLLTLLAEGKIVVLTGNFSDEFKQHIAQFLLTRSQEKTPCGYLLLISKEENCFPVISSYQHVVTPLEKAHGLLEKEKVLISTETMPVDLNHYMLSQLEAIAHYQKTYPDEPMSADAVLTAGLDKLPSMQKISSTLNSLESTAAETKTFNDNRYNQVKKALEGYPYVFLAGMTGAGKTTFMREIWKIKEKESTLHEGMSNLRKWAEDRTPGTKILFIDEVNISGKQWSEFEGLFCHPFPLIVIDNEKIDLTKDHKVIFAGNPLSYGGERQIPALFKNHGSNSVLFTPLPLGFIAHTMLVPVLRSVIPEQHLLQTMKPILAVYAYLISISTNDVLITSRELTMMALFTRNYCKYHKANSAQVAKYYAYALSKSFVHEINQKEFEEQFKPESALEKKLPVSQKLIINETNKEAWTIVDDLLNLRKTRRNQQFCFIQNSVIEHGGLGGVILEGEPGIGKSELVTDILMSWQLSEDRDFYRMPVSMPLTEKESLLLKAFYEGAIVVVDEINSAPMMERLLNDLLMGNIPKDITIPLEFKDKTPSPGFMIIGTQNPGPHVSSALSHRLQTVIMRNYTQAEMEDIIKYSYKKLTKETIIAMVSEYMTKKEKYGLCFRHLLKQAERENDDRQIVSLFLQEITKLPETEQGNWYKRDENSVDIEEIFLSANQHNDKRGLLFLKGTTSITRKALGNLGVNIAAGKEITEASVRTVIIKKIKEEEKEMKKFGLNQ